MIISNCKRCGSISDIDKNGLCNPCRCHVYDCSLPISAANLPESMTIENAEEYARDMRKKIDDSMAGEVEEAKVEYENEGCEEFLNSLKNGEDADFLKSYFSEAYPERVDGATVKRMEKLRKRVARKRASIKRGPISISDVLCVFSCGIVIGMLLTGIAMDLL